MIFEKKNCYSWDEWVKQLKILSKILRKKFIDIDYEIEKSSGLKNS